MDLKIKVENDFKHEETASLPKISRRPARRPSHQRAQIAHHPNHQHPPFQQRRKRHGNLLLPAIQLIGDLPIAREEAVRTFNEIYDNNYQYKTLGRSREVRERDDRERVRPAELRARPPRRRERALRGSVQRQDVRHCAHCRGLDSPRR